MQKLSPCMPRCGPVERLWDEFILCRGNIILTSGKWHTWRLGAKKAAGPDNLSARVLKEYAEELAPALTCIFQRSIDCGILPEDWRQANISPIFKKGDRTKASNYRPVSLTSICCKTLEHIIHANIMDHLDLHHILCEEQHGFRSKHSCESQLIQTVHDLSEALDNKQETDVIIMDFSKAFDKVAHRRLLSKLAHYGIRGNVHGWITSFLTERKQRVVISGESSRWVDVESGVPQGTVLGPLLFLLFINDLPNNIRSTVRLFADDCVLYNVIKTPADAEQLQQDLDLLRRWETSWQMEFNAAKCFVMKVTHAKNPQPYKYHLGDSTLEETSSHTYLGVEIKNDLKWNLHVNKIRSAANRNLGFLRRNISSCSRTTKARAFNSLVRPHLEYSCTVWDPYTQEQITQLDKVQRRGARFVFNDYDYTSSPTEMISKLKWESLQVRRKERRLLVLHQALHGHLSIPVNNILRPTTRPSRFTNDLIETLYRENVSFRDRDLKRQIPCHTASKNLDAQLLRNDTSFLSNLLCKSPLINYSPTIFVRLFQPIHWYETRILTFSSEKRAPISTMFTCRASHNVL